MKFEADGQLSSEYGIAVPGTGRVSVQWTPSGESDILYAKLYDQDGNVMAWDTVKVGGNSDWVNLGLPSGLLWATRNAGASSPTDYGNYYTLDEVICPCCASALALAPFPSRATRKGENAPFHTV